MNKLNDIRSGEEIDCRSDKRKFIWHACEICGKERWVLLRKGLPTHLRCTSCGRKGKGNSFWRGGHIRDNKGYVYIYVYPNDFFYPMTSKDRSYIAEHRLVMAKHLNRCLLPWEVVHHKNGIKGDNRLENLKLLPSQGEHISDSLLKREGEKLKKRVDELEKRVTLLEAENLLLRQNSKVVYT